MSVPPETTSGAPIPAAATSEGQNSSGSQSDSSMFDQHPELLAAGGFAGGLALAMILKRLGR